jgi:uncharacterized protein
MKLVYLTDIHDGLRGLKEVFIQTQADLYMLSGDIIYKAFFSFDRIIDFCTVQEELDLLAKEDGREMTPYDFATKVIRFPAKYSETIQSKCTLYRSLFNKAAKTMKEKYKLIDDLVKKYSNASCVFLPGNYDIDLQYTELYEMDIHRKSIELHGFKFSGYGGAPIVTSGIPEKLAVKFHEYTKNGIEYSEPEDFLKEEQPDIAIIHNPAYGYLDKIPGYGNVGSQGIRRFVDEYSPILVVSGHVHEDAGVIRKGRTVFLNSSNFGAVESVYGFQAGGFFAQIELNDVTRSVSRVDLWRMEQYKARQLMGIDLSGEAMVVDFFAEDSPISKEEFVRGT